MDCYRALDLETYWKVPKVLKFTEFILFPLFLNISSLNIWKLNDFEIVFFFLGGGRKI